MEAENTENAHAGGKKVWTGKDFEQMLKEVFGDSVVKSGAKVEQTEGHKVLEVQFWKFKS